MISFAGRKRLFREAVRTAATRLHLDEHGRVPAPGDQIQFSVGCPHIAPKNFIPRFGEMIRGRLFPAISKQLFPGYHGFPLLPLQQAAQERGRFPGKPGNRHPQESASPLKLLGI